MLPMSAGAMKRIRGRRLQAIRKNEQQFDPLCARCKTRGIVRAWTQLDHIVPLHKGGTDDETNRQGLCDQCHLEKTAADCGYELRPKIRVGLDGYPIESTTTGRGVKSPR